MIVYIGRFDEKSPFSLILFGSGDEEISSIYFRSMYKCISLLSPIGIFCSPSFELNIIPFIQRCLVLSLVKICQFVLEKKFCQSIFAISLHYCLTFKKAWPFIWTNLNPPYARMLCAKFGWRYATHIALCICYCTQNEIKVTLFMGWDAKILRKTCLFDYIELFTLVLFKLKNQRGVALHLNKLEFPSTKDVMCYVSLKFVQWFRKKRWKCKRFTARRTDRLIDNRQLEKPMSFQLIYGH